MSTTEQARTDTQERLGELGRRINALGDNVRRLGSDVRARATRRVDDLRAREAKARADVRSLADEATEHWHAAMKAIDDELTDLEQQLEIAEAEADAEVATDSEGFVRASERAVAAWDAYLDRLDARADAAKGAAGEKLHASVARARAQRDEAKRRIDEARRASSNTWAAAKASVREVIDDLDWSAEQAAEDIARYWHS
jgi:hypothetical protein